MRNIKEEALQAISSLPENAPIDEIMYRLYVIDKVRKGQEAVHEGKTLAVEELKKELREW
jgi:hypothetical protein